MIKPVALILAVAAFAGTLQAAPRGSVRATDPPSLAVSVVASQADRVQPTQLAVDPPEIVDRTLEAPVPGNHATWWEPWQPWPKQGKPLSLSPRHDMDGTLMLGALYRQIDPESIVVTSADGSRTFERGTDYVVNADYGQIGNLDGRLGTPGEGNLRVAFTIALQRIDLVQVGPDGRASLKRGESRYVCPAIPSADAGCRPLAGIYVAPWKRNGAHVVAPEDVYPIDPAPPVQPVNPDAVADSLAALRSGGTLKVAFIGDSITLGAEAGNWWDALWTDRNLAYPSRLVVALRQRFPRATVEPIAAFAGGTQTKFGVEKMEEVVVPADADLVVIAFGANDVSGSVGRGPSTPPEQFRENILAMVRRAKQEGMEVVLVVPMQLNPMHPNGAAARQPEYRRILLDVAESEGVGCADVYTAWLNQATRGVPPWSQLHNWLNHPGKAGHKLYADVLLRFFPE